MTGTLTTHLRTGMTVSLSHALYEVRSDSDAGVSGMSRQVQTAPSTTSILCTAETLPLPLTILPRHDTHTLSKTLSNGYLDHAGVLERRH